MDRRMYRETFKQVYTNPQLNAGVTQVIEYRNDAEKHGNLPHNTLVVANSDATCTLHVYLDDFSDADKPDYVIFPSQQLTVPVEDGVTFSHVFVKNTHGSSNVAANAIKVRVATVKRVEV